MVVKNVTIAGAKLVFAVAVAVLGFAVKVILQAASNFSYRDERDSTNHYEMGKFFNTSTGKFDNGNDLSGTYDSTWD